MPISRQMAKAKAEAVYWDNYVKYLDSVDERGSGVGKGKPKAPSQVLHVSPFGLNLPVPADGPRVLLKVSGNAGFWNDHKTKWTSAGVAYARDDWGDDPATEISLPFRAYREARLSLTTGLSATGTRAVAKGTKKPYLNYRTATTVTTSLPFGRPIGASGAGSNPTEDAVFLILAIQFQVNGQYSAGTQVTHVREKGE